MSEPLADLQLTLQAEQNFFQACLLDDSSSFANYISRLLFVRYSPPSPAVTYSKDKTSYICVQ